MAKSNRGGKAGSSAAQSQAQQSAILTQRRQQRQAQARQRVAPLTQAQIQQFQQAQDDLLDETNINVKYAVKQYIRADQQANGYSRAQNLNNKLETDGTLDQTEKKMVKYMDMAMKPTGQDALYVRADHAITPTGSGLMQKLGLANYQSMTNAQLNAAVAGKTWTENKYLSVSYNVANNPFISGPQAGGRAVIMNIKVGGQVKRIAGDSKQAEHILARGGSYKATGARFTGKTVNPRTGGSYKQLEIDVEIW